MTDFPTACLKPCTPVRESVTIMKSFDVFLELIKADDEGFHLSKTETFHNIKLVLYCTSMPF